MKYVFMYIVCGIAWTAWLYFKFEEYLNSEEVNSMYEETKKKLFNDGVIISTNTVKKLAVGVLLIWWILTWPYQVFWNIIGKRVKNKIKKH